MYFRKKSNFLSLLAALTATSLPLSVFELRCSPLPRARVFKHMHRQLSTLSVKKMNYHFINRFRVSLLTSAIHSLAIGGFIASVTQK